MGKNYKVVVKFGPSPEEVLELKPAPYDVIILAAEGWLRIYPDDIVMLVEVAG